MANRLPGVVVRIVPEIGQVTIPLFQRYVCIIGQGEHRLLQSNEEVVRSSVNNYDIFSKSFVELIRVGLVPDASDFVQGTHFNIYTQGGQNVGIQWNPLVPASTNQSWSIAEPFDFTTNNKLKINIDGLGDVIIDLSSLGNSATAAQVANVINTALSNAYGTAYNSVAQLFPSPTNDKVQLVSPTSGENSKIVFYDIANNAFVEIWGNGPAPNTWPNGILVLTGTGKQPAAGQTYYVTYRYKAPDSTYEPTLYFDLKPIYNEHGSRFLANPSNPTQINEIVLMAEMAFQDLPERIPGIVVAQLDLRNAVNPYEPTPLELRDAYIAMLEKLERVTEGKLYLVLNTTDSQVLDEYFNHVRTMSQPEIKAERMLCITMPPGSSINDYISSTGAPHYKSERVMLFYPSMIYVDSVGQDLPNYYAPLIYAARKTAVPIATPINVEPLPGITLKTAPTYNEKKILLANGVAVVDIVEGQTVILHGITTRTDFVIYEEENVVDIADYVKFIWRKRMFELFKNAPIDAPTLRSMVTTSIALLDSLIRDRIIADYKNIQAVQDNVEPRMVRMRGKVKPMFHVLYMDIEFTFSTTL